MGTLLRLRKTIKKNDHGDEVVTKLESLLSSVQPLLLSAVWALLLIWTSPDIQMLFLNQKSFFKKKNILFLVLPVSVKKFLWHRIQSEEGSHTRCWASSKHWTKQTQTTGWCCSIPSFCFEPRCFYGKRPLTFGSSANTGNSYKDFRIQVAFDKPPVMWI